MGWCLGREVAIGRSIDAFIVKVFVDLDRFFIV
jgi:hypothetical protein